MRIIVALALVFAAGCTQAVDAPSFTDTMPDAGGDVRPTPDAMPAPDARVPPMKVDAGNDAPATETSSSPEAGSAIDAPAKVDADAGTTAPEASTPDATPTPAVDAGNDGAIATEAGTDSAPTVDAAPPSSDAGTDAGDVDPVCTSPATACQRAIETDSLVRSTFPQPCAVEGERKCGGVWRGVVETLPMICRDAHWRLAGSWSGAQWMPLYTCSSGCGAAGKICNP
jgi:hypothetical protein